jgi:hypothetical protein
MELIYIIIFGLGFILGKIHTYMKITNLIKETAKRHGISLEQELDRMNIDNDLRIIYQLIVESHNDILYLFEKESNRFICQGASVQELAKLAKEQGNIINAAVVYDNRIFTFVNGESTEFSG